jgi:hypothetical protein
LFIMAYYNRYGGVTLPFRPHRSCSDCRGTTFIEVIQDGDVVCAGCGLVTESHIVDDRPLMDNCRDVHSVPNATYARMGTRDGQLLRCVNGKRHTATFGHTKDDLVRAMERLDIDSQAVEMMAREIFQTKKSEGYGGPLRPLWAFALYEACKLQGRGAVVTKELACRALEIDSSDEAFKGFYKTKNATTDVVAAGIRQRLARNAAFLVGDPRQRMRVIAEAERMDDRLKAHAEYVNKRPSKIDGIVFFIAAQAVMSWDKAPSVADCGKAFDIAPATWKTNARVIANLLQSKKTAS